MNEFGSTENIIARRTAINRKCVIILVVFAVLAAFIIGILIGRYAVRPDNKPEAAKDGVFLPSVSESLMKDEDPSIGDLLIKNMKSENIRNNLKMLCEQPHLAGTKRSHELARHLKTFWEDAGLDHVTLTPYDVLLSYPNMSNLNYVELLDEHNTSVYKSNLTESVLTPEENKTNVVPPFNAYSAPGDVQGDLVYVNYGRDEDYVMLVNKTNINVTGKIVLARYGKIFRGDKVHFAELHGAIGIILFSDPHDVTNGDINQVYPQNWWLPPSGTQRGTVFIGYGDPLTADYPATENAFREKDKDFYLPAIPCHPIGYGIAIHLMSNLGGDVVIGEWQGGMNVTYRYGDSFKTPRWKAHIMVSTSNKRVMTYNAIGIIRGSIEPDRYVLVGNHRDAWVFGAVDASGGTAIMMEMSRVMGDLVKSGRWRPRRSIVFCSWGAEEYGLVGSTEWVEHYTKSLGARAIAYLNVDIAVEGNYTFWARGTPLIMKSLFAATKRVPNPNQTEIAEDRATVYDTWKMALPSKQDDRPEITLPGAGSDDAPFRDRIGVPIASMTYTYDKKTFNVSTYPMYHSMYETFHLVDTIMDRGFKYHTAIGQVWVEMAHHLSDSLILPFNVSDYGLVMADFGKTLLKEYGTIMENHDLNTSLLTVAIANFTGVVHEFEKRVRDTNLNNPFAVRRINDQLMQLDRAFIDPAGLPGRRLKRHILFAESVLDNYSGSSFPGLSDALVYIKQNKDVDKQWKIVKKHFSVILFTIQSATSTLRDVTDFMYDY